jgi:glycosyltransferase involved in cell wall biosynthesis
LPEFKNQNILEKRAMRILYVHSTVQPPPTNLQTDRFNLLSGELEGDVLQPIWFQIPEEVEAMFGPGSYPVYTAGKFRYHWFLSSARRGVRQRLATFRFYLRKGMQLHRERRFDCIVAYSHMTTGVLAGILKLLTGAKLIIEIVTSPDLVYITERAKPGPRERVMKVYSDFCLHVSMFLADRAHFLYPNQLRSFRLLRNRPNSVFHEFVPVSLVDRQEPRDGGEQYILLAGAPWYLKGADVLIKAFLMLAPDFLQVKLKILGHYLDRTELDALSGGSPQVEILQAIPHLEALEIIKKATVMVMPSRCEGLSRALIEAMAAAIPLVGSDVGGIPVLVRDGENGFLVPVGDYKALSDRLRKLLGNAALRERMGESGYARAHGELNEQTYVAAFTRMIQDTVAPRPPGKSATLQ